jgi:hypothetical protein
MRGKRILACLLAACCLATDALAHVHAGGGHHSFLPADARRRLAGAGPHRRRCTVGERLTHAQRMQKERSFYVRRRRHSVRVTCGGSRPCVRPRASPPLRSFTKELTLHDLPRILLPPFGLL